MKIIALHSHLLTSPQTLRSCTAYDSRAGSPMFSHIQHVCVSQPCLRAMNYSYAHKSATLRHHCLSVPLCISTVSTNQAFCLHNCVTPKKHKERQIVNYILFLPSIVLSSFPSLPSPGLCSSLSLALPLNCLVCNLAGEASLHSSCACLSIFVENRRHKRQHIFHFAFSGVLLSCLIVDACPQCLISRFSQSLFATKATHKNKQTVIGLVLITIF